MVELIPLCTGVIEVAPALAIGKGPAGMRSIAAIESVSLTGERLSASLASPTAADWMVLNGTVGVVDVRLPLRTHDGALIYMQYGGRLDLANTSDRLIARVAPVFETGHEGYAWLNAVQAVGRGVITVKDGAARIDYEFFEIR